MRPIAVLLLILTIGCAKKAEVSDTTILSDLTRVVYQRSASASSMDHLTMAEDITFGATTLKALAEVPEWKAAVGRYGELTRGQRYTYDHSPARVIHLPATNGESVLVYELKGKYMVLAMRVSHAGDLTRYETRSVAGRTYFELSVSSSGRIQRGEVTNDLPASLTLDDATARSQMSTCPENTRSFTACFQCAVEECSNDLLCTIACGFQPASCVIGFTLACVIK